MSMNKQKRENAKEMCGGSDPIENIYAYKKEFYHEQSH